MIRDSLDCGSYTAVKHLERSMAVIEQGLAKRIRVQVNIDDRQFRFTPRFTPRYTPSNSTIDASFIVKQLQEKLKSKDKTFFYAFVDLVKASDIVPGEVVRWVII